MSLGENVYMTPYPAGAGAAEAGASAAEAGASAAEAGTATGGCGWDGSIVPGNYIKIKNFTLSQQSKLQCFPER